MNAFFVVTSADHLEGGVETDPFKGLEETLARLAVVAVEGKRAVDERQHLVLAFKDEGDGREVKVTSPEPNFRAASATARSWSTETLPFTVTTRTEKVSASGRGG